MALNFSPQTTFASGADPISVAVGDLNGDGKPDLVVANSTPDNVSVLLGNGSGSFSAQTTFVTGIRPLSVAVGDFNGDGKPDLVVANFVSNNVSVLLGNGSGSFSAQTTFAVATNPISVVVGDFNGDNRPDLAVTNFNSNDVSVLLGTGSGSFSAQTTFAAGTNPRSVVVGDFNGDSRPDLAVANRSSNNVSVLLGNGSGSFSAQTTFAVETSPRSVAVGDFNGDSKPDLAVANYSSNSVSVLLGNGSGSFSAQTTFAAGTNPYSVAVGDFNGDSRPDLAVANRSSNNVSVLLGDGSGGIVAQSVFAAGTNPNSVAVGDFGGDSKPDLAVANRASNNVSVLLNTTVPIPTVDLSVSTSAGTEAGITAITVTATASSAVTGNQTVSLGITGTGITVGDYNLSNSTITIPSGQTQGSVTFTVVDDSLVEGTETATLTISSLSAGIALGTTTTQNITITDNDTAGYTLSKNTAAVNESGTTDTFTVVLTAQPLTNVVFSVTSNDTGEATVSPTPLTFTNANWNIPQTVTITGVDDLIVDGNQTSAVTVSVVDASSDNAFDPLADQTVTVTTVDNDTAGITVTPTSGLVTTEAGGQATFSIVLTSQPTADVTIPISSSDTTEGTAFPAPLTFTSLNWNTPQTVTVTGVDDLIVDGNIAYQVVTGTATSTDTNYNNFNASDVAVTNNDNDIAGISLSLTGSPLAENGGVATVTATTSNLNPLPITVNLGFTGTATNGTDYNPSASSITIPANSLTGSMTLTSINDLIAEPNETIIVDITGVINATENGIQQVTATITDDDVAGFTITPTSGLVTTETGGTANFTVKLTSQPTVNVTLGLSSSNTAEGIISTPSLTFTPANFNTPQTVTITGIDDLVVDGNIAYSIITATASSTDLNFNGVNPIDVSVINNDNDTTLVGDPVTTIPSGTGRLILGNNLDNTIVGSSSNDTIYGYAGFDRIFGQDGNDYIDGGIGNDSLSGGVGNDTLIGGAGNDSIRGDAGADLLIGGADSDVFVYSSPSEGGDTITDFSGSLDSIRVSQGGFGGGLLPGVLLASQFGLGAAATTSSQRFIYDTATGILRFDIDGNGAGASSILATLTGSPALLSSNISVF